MQSAATFDVPLGWWAFFITFAVALTTVAAARQLRRPGGDGLFWVVFAGFCAVFPAVLIPAVRRPLDGAVLSVLALVIFLASAVALLRTDDLRRSRARRRRREQRQAQVLARHDELLLRWCEYELDAGRQIEFPAMTDVGCRETAAMIRAMRDAAELRAELDAAGLPSFEGAVLRLGAALDAAERAAGASQAA